MIHHFCLDLSRFYKLISQQQRHLSLPDAINYKLDNNTLIRNRDFPFPNFSYNHWKQHENRKLLVVPLYNNNLGLFSLPRAL